MREISSFHNHTCMSFNDGVSTPEELVQAAKDNGLRSVAITDHGTTHSHARVFLHAKKLGVRALLGTEAYVINDFDEWRAMKEKLALEKKKDAEEIEFDSDKILQDKANRKVLYRKGHLVMVAQNRVGLANIYNLTYQAHKVGYFNKPRMDKKMLADRSEGIVASSACMGGVISSKVSAMMRGELEWADLKREVEEFAAIFPGRFFLEVQTNEAPFQKEVNAAMVRLSEETKVPLIVTQDAHYVKPEDWQAQQILHMLLTHRGKQGLTFGTLPETYEWNVKSLNVKTADTMWDNFRRWNPEVPEKVLEQAFENTLLADSLISDYEPDTNMRLPSLPYSDTFQELLKSSAEGLKARGLDKDDRYMERLQYELRIIRDKGLANYFLVVRNICNAARKEMLIGPGRGSAAGSLICYLTGITNVDPIEHKLMFERFINVDRVETPDIDLDFQDVDGVKDILRREFGEDNVACLSTYGTSQIKGLMKDVSRVYDIDHNECNKINAMIEREMKALYKEDEGVTRSAITIKLDDVYRLSPSFRAFIQKYPQTEYAINALYGREHHVGRHASGVVIGDDLPSETSIFTSKGVVQASFTDGIVNKSASSMGLVKFDILGLATLEVISQACKLIAEREGTSYEEALKKIDPKVMDFNSMEIMKTVFWDGNMTGIFSVTSAGMMKLFQRVKPTCFDDVAAVTALFRPGPLGSGMDAMFADRKNGLEKVTYDHPILEGIMKDTYGCLVYQEQMLEIGRQLGQMSWKDTNRLRKLFLKKDKSKQDDFIKKEEDELKAKLIEGCVANGLSVEKGEELWEMCGRFGGYGFNRAHSIAYAMVTMQTAFLRTYYPMEFFSALLSAGQSGDLQTYVNDIRKQGFEILPVDVNRSTGTPKIEGNAIRLALSSIKGIGASAVQKIVATQPFTSFEQFLTESGSNKTVTEVLIKVGAFSDVCPGVSVKTLRARHDLFRTDKKLSHKKNRDALEPTLRAVDAGPDDIIELMEFERELMGFNLRGTPYSINGRYDKVDRLVEAGLCEKGLKEFMDDESKLELICPLLVKSSKEKPQKNGKLFSFLRLTDRDGMEIEAPCFGNIWEHVRTGVRPGDVYIIRLHRKDDDPGRLVVGRPGWKHSKEQCATYFIPIDKIQI